MPNVSKNKFRLPWENKPTGRKTWLANQRDYGLYNSAQWRRLSHEVRTDEPFCRECAKKGITTLATVTDHIKAVSHGGDFWNRTNLQPLCTPCHNGKKT